MKKQTAVQIIFEQFNLMSNATFKSWMLNNYDALETMEREQIVDAYSHGWHDGQDVILQQVKHIDKGGDAAGETLYNDTYGGEQ